MSYQRLSDVTSYCHSKYNAKTFQHCLRVAAFASQNVCLDNEEKEIAYIFALCHDLLEDTDAKPVDIVHITGLPLGLVLEVLKALTKDKSEDYNSYIKRLKQTNNKFAYIVKIADMKDHLCQTETLTDRLKEKYWLALPELL